MDITLIVALIAAIAAIVSPVITEIISQFGARRLKKIDLLFTAQVEAYKNYISVTSLFPFSPEYRDIHKLSDAQNQAFLYSSLETRKKLSDYAILLSDEANIPPGTLGKAQHEAILAMQRELRKY